MTQETPRFIVDIMLSLAMDELAALQQLSNLNQTDIEATARQCMMRACADALDVHKTAITVEEPKQLELDLNKKVSCCDVKSGT